MRTCEYCKTIYRDGAHCISCGAPLKYADESLLWEWDKNVVGFTANFSENSMVDVWFLDGSTHTYAVESLFSNGVISIDEARRYMGYRN